MRAWMKILYTPTGDRANEFGRAANGAVLAASPPVLRSI